MIDDEMKERPIDEQLAEMLNEMEQQQKDELLYQDQAENYISKGYIWIKGSKKEVERRCILDLFDMVLPIEFQEMKPEYVESKYPFLPAERTYYILTNPDTTVNVLFHASSLLVNPEEIYSIRNSLLEIFKRQNPTVIVQKVSSKNGTMEIPYFTFITQGLDGPMFNLSFFCSINGGLVRGSWNCPKRDQESWEDLMEQMIESIQQIK